MTDTKHPLQTITDGIAERYEEAKNNDGFTWTSSFGQHGFTCSFRLTAFDHPLTIGEKEIITKAILGATQVIAEKRGYDKPPVLKNADYQRNVAMDLSEEPEKPHSDHFSTNGA